MRITRKRITALVVTLALLASAGFAVVYVVGTMRETAVEQKLGEILKARINATLVPQLEFDGIDYQQPKTVVLRNVRLVADDPDAAGGSVAIFQADSLTLELGEVPRKGRPLVLASLTLERPTVRLVWSESAGKVIGFSDLVAASPGEDAVPVSDALRMSRIALREASVVVDTRRPGTTPTVIDEITTDLLIDPAAGGRYRLALELDRAPAMSAQIDAVLDVDARTFTFADSAIELAMAREQDRYLPQSVQELLAPYDITGDATLTLSGVLELDAWRDSAMRIGLELAGASAVFGQYQLPIERLKVFAVSADQTLEVQRIDAAVLDGEMRGDAVIRLSQGFPFDLRLGGQRIAIEQVLGVVEGESPRFAGLAEFQLHAHGPLAHVGTELRGEGTLEVHRGRFARMVVVSDLIDFMVSGGNLSRPEDGRPAGRDRAEAVFKLRGDHAYFSQLDIAGSWFAMRSRGKVFFNRSLAMQVNGGPLEKVQDVLGPIGDVFGAVTDSFVAYRVEGAFDNTEIRMLALGGLRGAPGDDEDDLPPWTPPLIDGPADGDDEG
ncbi:MAG: hypothetical protein AAGA29_08030 [Planctomycetota bacterium]